MGLNVFHTTPQGRVLVNSDILDIARRLQNGDPTCLWEGDERMHVVFNPTTEKYEVWRLGEDGVDRILSSWNPKEFDARVVKWVAEHDTRRVDVLAAIEKHNDQQEAKAQEEAAELEKELHKDLKWIRHRLYLD